MAADANRPTSSLVSRFSATDAASVASYLPTAATTGRFDSRSRRGHQVVGAQSRAHAAGFAETAQLGGGVVVGQHPQVDPAGDHAVLDIVHRVRDVVGPVHHLGLQARPRCRRAGPHPVGGGSIVGVEAELAGCSPAHATDTWSPRPARHGSGSAPHCGLAGQGLWAPGGSGCGSSARCPRTRRARRPARRARVRRCARTAGARCRGPARPCRRGRGRSPARSPCPGRSGPPPASASAGCAGCRSGVARPPASCRPAGAKRRCAALAPGRGRSRCDARCRSRQRGTLRALRPPDAAGRSRRIGRNLLPPTPSLPGRFFSTT